MLNLMSSLKSNLRRPGPLSVTSMLVACLLVLTGGADAQTHVRGDVPRENVCTAQYR